MFNITNYLHFDLSYELDIQGRSPDIFVAFMTKHIMEERSSDILMNCLK